ncbi:MAG TPA: TraR/DksA C4-type zinc finger protein [Candidatus Paceibacterota bacterium]|nr:TraR/DksA C4-type zinc finger protein [Candidatus Paceibacterota bacterium]
MINTNYFQKKLEEERLRLEDELQKLGRINPEDPEDWEPVPPADEEDIRNDPDENVAADAIEEFESQSAVEVVLENQLVAVKEALGRIENGTYGICKVGGEEIEEDRLEANPSAETCKKHMDDVDKEKAS